MQKSNNFNSQLELKSHIELKTEKITSSIIQINSLNLLSKFATLYLVRLQVYITIKREQKTRRKRRNHSPAFKAKVALVALKGDRTLVQLAFGYNVHSSIIRYYMTQKLLGMR